MAIANRFVSVLQAEAPDLKALSSSVDNLWFLRFITLRSDIRKLSKVHQQSISKIKYLGKKNLVSIMQWKKEVIFADTLDYTASILYDDAMRILELKNKIKELTGQIDGLIPFSLRLIFQFYSLQLVNNYRV